MAGKDERPSKDVEGNSLDERESRDNQDRRKFARIPVRVPLTIVEGWSRVSFSTVNVSIGGIFIETAFIYKTGTHLNFTFTLPGQEKPIKAIGEVRHHYRYTFVDSRDRHRIIFGIGVRYVELEEDSEKLLTEFIDSRRDQLSNKKRNSD